MRRITDISLLTCPSGISIREALSRIDASVHLFQVVLDDAGRLLGTVTDGDVRRALLRGIGLDDAVAACMNRKPTVGRIGDDSENADLLGTLGSTRAFLPLLDRDEVVVEILVAHELGSRRIAALIQAGGRGTRLGERTRNTPKPLLEVGGRPILDHVLSRLEAAGIGEVFVSVQYLGDQIASFVGRRANRARIEVIREHEPLGTAGAIGLLPEARERQLLVLNGDVITRVDIRSLLAFHEIHEHDATVTVARHEVQIPFGVIRHGEDGQFLGVEEKPSQVHFVAAGMYMLSPEIAALVPGDRRLDMPDLLNEARSIGLRMGLFPIHEYWIDVGRPDDLSAADAEHHRNA